MGRSVIATAVLLAGCLPEPNNHKCSSLADCPPNTGYNACQEGLCFQFAHLPPAAAPDTETSEPNPCPQSTLSAEADPDCQSAQVELPTAASLSSPAVSGNTVYVAVREPKALRLARIDPGSADPILIDIGAAPPAEVGADEPVVLSDGSVLVGAQSGLCRVDGENSVQWPCDRGGPPAMAPVPLRNDRILLGQADKTVVLLAAGEAAGAPAALDDVPHHGAVAADGSFAYVATESGTVAGVSTDPLQVVWQKPLGAATPPVLDRQNHLWLGDSDGRLKVFTAKPGTEPSLLAEAPAGATAGPLILDSEGRAILTTDARRPAVLSLQGPLLVGEQVGEAETDLLGAPLVTASGRVFIRGIDKVWGYDRVDGELKAVWAHAGGGATDTPLNMTADGRLIVVQQPSTVLLLAPGVGGLADEVWPRHRRDARSSAGFSE